MKVDTWWRKVKERRLWEGVGGGGNKGKEQREGLGRQGNSESPFVNG